MKPSTVASAASPEPSSCFSRVLMLYVVPITLPVLGFFLAVLLLASADCSFSYIPTLQVDSAIASLNNNTKHFNFSLSFSNPTDFDHSRMYFDNVTVELFHKEEHLPILLNNRSSLPSFFTDRYTGGGRVVVFFTPSVKEYGRDFVFGLNVNVSVHYRNRIFRSRPTSVKFLCFPLLFQSPPNQNNTTARTQQILQALPCTDSDSELD